MDIITVMRFIIILPIATYIIVIGLFYLLRHQFKFKASLSVCMSICFKWAAITAGFSLVAFVVWMVWLTVTTNQDLGQAPLVWIFGIAPISFMVGVIVGFILWCKSSLTTKIT
jgi:hypothetical protein